jgi:branched-subunit amino acid aminotransferase/4-amino-4-deoxychorismate lyase
VPPAGVHELAGELPAGVYTALSTVGHHRFLGLEAHLDRLERNLGELGYGLPLDRTALRAALDSLVRSYPGADARLRVDVLPGPPPGLDTDATVLVAIAPHEPVPEAYRRDGVCVSLTSELRRERPRIKTTTFVALRRPYPLQTQRCYEHVMVDAGGRLLECTSANFYGVRGGAVHTAHEGVLEGITRELVYRLARELDIEVVRTAVTTGDYASLDEAFLSSSTRGIVPVVEIEGRAIGDGRPGPVTRRLMQALDALVEREARPACPVPEGPVMETR